MSISLFFEYEEDRASWAPLIPAVEGLNAWMLRSKEGGLAGGEGAGWSVEMVCVAPPEGWAHFKLLIHFLGRWSWGRGRPSGVRSW